MPQYEYKVVPAPNRGQKARGVKGPEARFAYALEVVMNDMGREGWEYVRAETLPSEERQGLTHTATAFRNVLVFRRERADVIGAYRPRLLEKPKQQEALPAPSTETEDTPQSRPQSKIAPGKGHAAHKRALPEEDAPVTETVRSVPSILQRRAAQLNGTKGDMAAE